MSYIRSSAKWLCMIAVALLQTGCNGSINEAEYNLYLKNPSHGLIHTLDVNGISITCAYRPKELMIMQDLKNSSNVYNKDFLLKSYNDKVYLCFYIKYRNKSIENEFANDPDAYQRVITYLNTGIASNVFLSTASKDSVSAISSIYFRSFGVAGPSTLLLVFDTHQLAPQRGLYLTLYDQMLGLGTLRFHFKAADLASLPSLQFD